MHEILYFDKGFSNQFSVFGKIVGYDKYLLEFIGTRENSFFFI